MSAPRRSVGRDKGAGAAAAEAGEVAETGSSQRTQRSRGRGGRSTGRPACSAAGPAHADRPAGGPSNDVPTDPHDSVRLPFSCSPRPLPLCVLCDGFPPRPSAAPGLEFVPVARRQPLSQTRALRVLKEVAEALNSAATEQGAAGEALSRMASLLGVETGWVWLRDPASGRFYSAAVQSLPPYLQEPVRMTGRSCWCLELFQSGQLTARNIDVVECSRLAPAVRSRQAAETHGLRCHASVPLYAGDRPLGVMNLAMRGWRRLTRQELDLLTTIANQVGVAIERARLGEQLIQHARADERSRIARDVHDTLAQGFTAIALQIEAALSHLEPRAAARPSLRRALDVAREGVDETQAIDRGAACVSAAEPAAQRSARRALAPVHRRHRRARAHGGDRRAVARSGGIRGLPHRQRSAEQRPQARRARARYRSGSRSSAAGCA